MNFVPSHRRALLANFTAFLPKKRCRKNEMNRKLFNFYRTISAGSQVDMAQSDETKQKRNTTEMKSIRYLHLCLLR